jgi:hypothetical protein
VLESRTDAWADVRQSDIKVTYTQLGYEFRNAPKTGLDAARLICRIAQFYSELDRPDIRVVRIGLTPANVDMLTAATLSRLLFVITNQQLVLEMPQYANAIGAKALRAN